MAIRKKPRQYSDLERVFTNEGDLTKKLQEVRELYEKRAKKIEKTHPKQSEFYRSCVVMIQTLIDGPVIKEGE